MGQHLYLNLPPSRRLLSDGWPFRPCADSSLVLLQSAEAGSWTGRWHPGRGRVWQKCTPLDLWCSACSLRAAGCRKPGTVAREGTAQGQTDGQSWKKDSLPASNSGILQNKQWSGLYQVLKLLTTFSDLLINKKNGKYTWFSSFSRNNLKHFSLWHFAGILAHSSFTLLIQRVFISTPPCPVLDHTIH